MTDSGSGSKSPQPSSTEDWRKLAQQASIEADPERLIELVQRLCEVLDTRDANSPHAPKAERPLPKS